MINTLTMCRLVVLAAMGLASGPGCSRGGSNAHELAVDEDGEAADDGLRGVLAVEPAEVVSVPLGQDPDDRDGDGYSAEVDHDDLDPRSFPGAAEVPCDGVDQDGDGDDPCTPDRDGDGVRAADDCDDLDPSVHPFAPEVRCNGEDENCDGLDDCDRDGDGILDRNDLEPDDPDVGLPRGDPVALDP